MVFPKKLVNYEILDPHPPHPPVRTGRTIDCGTICGLDRVVEEGFKIECASTERSTGFLPFSGVYPLTIFYYYKIFLFYNNNNEITTKSNNPRFQKCTKPRNLYWEKDPK
jgi:hypothetical protein